MEILILPQPIADFQEEQFEKNMSTNQLKLKFFHRTNQDRIYDFQGVLGSTSIQIIANFRTHVNQWIFLLFSSYLESSSTASNIPEFIPSSLETDLKNWSIRREAFLFRCFFQRQHWLSFFASSMKNSFIIIRRTWNKINKEFIH